MVHLLSVTTTRDCTFEAIRNEVEGRTDRGWSDWTFTSDSAPIKTHHTVAHYGITSGDRLGLNAVPSSKVQQNLDRLPEGPKGDCVVFDQYWQYEMFTPGGQRTP